jgi:predicted CopG family antitoxin
MGTKTISLTEEAYERLRAHRKGPGDSFSRVVMRAKWDEKGVTGAELLKMWEEAGPFFTNSELEAIEETQLADAPPEDKWKMP